MTSPISPTHVDHIFTAEVYLPGAGQIMYPYPAGLPEPELAAVIDEDNPVTEVTVTIDGIRMIFRARGVPGGYSGDTDTDFDTLPFSDDQRDALRRWATGFVMAVHVNAKTIHLHVVAAGVAAATGSDVSHLDDEAMPDGFDDTDLLALTVHVPVLPTSQGWPGTGRGEHGHFGRDDSDAQLIWEAPGSTEFILLGTAVETPITGDLATFASLDVDWDAVGVAEEDAMNWLLREHELVCLPALVLQNAISVQVLRVLAGFTEPVPSPYR